MNNNNIKALEIVNNFKNHIYSYLNADPKKVAFNHIVTILNKNRNANNGMANFRFDVQEKSGFMRKYNVRVETGIFNNQLFIKSSKVYSLAKSDLIIFTDEKDSIYISEKSRFGDHKWLLENKYHRQEQRKLGKNIVTYNAYNLKNLIENHEIIQISYNRLTKKIVVIDNLDFLYNKNDTRVWKEYHDYKIDTSHITQVQFDVKQPRTLFWCTKASRYTNQIGSSVKIANYISELVSIDFKNVYQRINRCYNKMTTTGKAYCTKIPAKPEVLNNFNYDPDMFDDKGNLVLYFSNDINFDVIENKVELATDDLKAYQKEYQKANKDKRNIYQKVVQWIKKHPGNTSWPKKWTQEDIEIAVRYLGD